MPDSGIDESGAVHECIDFVVLVVVVVGGRLYGIIVVWARVIPVMKGLVVLSAPWAFAKLCNYLLLGNALLFLLDASAKY